MNNAALARIRKSVRTLKADGCCRHELCRRSYGAIVARLNVDALVLPSAANF
jgi:hypothetical protein